jgi:hypothetical protein
MSDSDSDSFWGGLFGVALGLALVSWLLYTIVVYLYENARTIFLWIGPFILVAGTWYGLRAIHRLFSSHPAKDAVKSRSIADADRILCRIEKGGLSFMHENQARNADKLRQGVENETNKIRQQIENLEAELSRREAVNAGSIAEAIAAVRSSPHRDELRRSLVRRLAEREGIHVQR